MEIIRNHIQCKNPYEDGLDLYYIKMYYDNNFNIEYYYNTYETKELFGSPLNEFYYQYDKLYYVTYNKEELTDELETLMVKIFLKKYDIEIKNIKNNLKKLEKDKKLLLSLLNKYFRNEKIKKIIE